MLANQQLKTKRGQKVGQDYVRLSRESQVVEDIVRKYSASLTSALFMIGRGLSPDEQLEISQMRDIREKVLNRISRMRQVIEQELTEMSGVQSIGTIRLQMRQLAGVLQEEDARSASILEDLRSQLSQKLHEIADCDKSIARSRQKAEQQEWKRSYYVNVRPVHLAQRAGGDYLSVLKELQYRLKMQINLQEQQRIMFSYKLNETLRDHQSGIFRAWGKLQRNDRQCMQIESSYKGDQEVASENSYTLNAAEHQRWGFNQNDQTISRNVFTDQSFQQKDELDQSTPLCSQSHLNIPNSYRKSNKNSVIIDEQIQ